MTQLANRIAGMPTRFVGQRKPVRGWQLFLVSAGVLALVGFVRLHDLYSVTLHEDGDAALNSWSVLRAERFDQFVGNYSRVGFYHPGPALIYVLASGQALFHGLLRVVPGPANGQELAAMLYGAVLLALSVRILYRLTRSLPAALLALGSFAVFGHQHGVFGQLWFPYLYIAPFLLLMLSGAAVAAGMTAELPWLVLACCLLVQGHVSFIMFATVSAAVVVLCWYLRHRGAVRVELGAHRAPAIGAVAVLAAFALPMVLDVVLHYPGQWPLYLRYALHSVREPRTPRQVLEFLGYFLRSAQPMLLTIAAAVTAVALTATERDHERRRVFGSLYLMVGLQTVLMVIYIARGVDTLTPINRYVGFFYEAAPVLLAVTAGSHVLLRVRTAPGSRMRARRATTIAALSVGIVLVLATAFSPHWVIDTGARTPANDYPAIVAALKGAPARAGRPVEFDFPHDSWPEVAGIAIQATRSALPYCLKDPNWALLFGADRICAAGASGDHWQVRIGPLTAVPNGATVVWRNEDSAVFS